MATETAECERIHAPMAGRCVLVTGGSSGLGRAIATGLRERGGTVALVARGESRSREASGKLDHDVLCGNGHGRLAYSAARAGLIGLIYALPGKPGLEGTTVNVIAPGFVPDAGFSAEPPSDEHRQATVARTPLGGVGEPEDVGAAVVYLASDEAGWVSGQSLRVNGGELFGR